MKWIDAARELPKEHEEVIIRCGSTFLLASYDHTTGMFVDKLGVPCGLPISKILWARMLESDQVKMK